jgi:hypothetical protein
MDGSQFDSLVKGLTAYGSRRRALSALLAGVVGLLNWPGQEDAEAHDLSDKCKKKSGKAKRKCLKKARKHNAAHIAFPCQGQPDDTPCNGDGRCLNGVCNPKPTCSLGRRGISGSITCNKTTPETCCSGECITFGVDICDTSATGKPCVETENCDANLACVGYVCRPV